MRPNFIIFSTIALFFSIQVKAMSVSPMSTEYDPVGEGTSVVYSVSNPTSQPLAIEVSVQERKTNLNGTKVNVDPESAKKLFSIFPAATIVPPKAKKGIRVVYVGPRDLASEKAFWVNITEKPMKNDATDQSAFKVRREFQTAAYVRPKGVKPDVRIISVESLGKDRLTIKIKNQGTAHQLVHKISIRLKDDVGGSSLVTEKTEEGLLTNFLAGEDRQIIIRRPAQLNGKEVTGIIESME